ncbi:putative NAD(P)/FAD-binding protein YdhS [Azospirillum agricola]|uniref:FAD/NAD(P)-binding protein n=1 Tax=Azospirillum agricola TaxID=1720247 RepID=UPI001AE71B96|nr:FAD/NAD(P)-binding protein [Azospirillum agricola]MBP2231892.1 putative NAD(P)/FAD-binding protein YdhS [Azospirillum agricola]
MLRVTIVGGGVSGVTVALRLARSERPIQVDLVEPRSLLGAGLTYSATDPRHRVNVPTTRMSVEGEASEDFHRWYTERGEDAADPDALADGCLYPRREAFGRYLDERVRGLFDRPGPLRLRHRRTQAVSAVHDGSGYAVRLADGTTLCADALVLCTGNPPPELPGPLAALAGDARVTVDPWAPGAAADVPPDGRVLIVGSGLSMGDAVATLDARGHRGPIVALSRHGLVPRPRPFGFADSFGDFATDPPRRVSVLLRRVRATLREAAAANRPWTDVLDAVRVQNGALWAALPLEEKHRFRRHLRPYWDVHRFQSAPQIDRLVAEKRAVGALTVRAGALVHAAARPDGLEIGHRRRGSDVVTVERFDALVNCTGAGHGAALRRNPLLAALAAAGLIQGDALGIGIAVDPDARAVAADARPSPALFVVGPPTRGTLGEVVGASEIAPRANAVAERLLTLEPVAGEEWVLEGTASGGE